MSRYHVLTHQVDYVLREVGIEFAIITLSTVGAVSAVGTHGGSRA